MASVIGLVLPFFGLIFLGYFVARITRQSLEALGWMNTFIIYVALPALFFNLLSRTPVEELTQWRFIVATTLSTYVVFALMFAIAIVRGGGNIAEATIQGLGAAYGNIGYMGPGLALLAFGQPAIVPVALIFCFDNTLHFIMAPMLMALAGGGQEPWLKVAFGVVRRVVTHPFIIATVVGVLGAIFEVRPPEPLQRLLDYLANAAAPCALFAMGVTLALRPLKRVPASLGFIVPIKLVAHPLIVWVMLGWAGTFPEVWVFAAVLQASLPSATNVFVIAQQYKVWVERASATVLLTTLCSVVTVTGVLYLMTNGLLPADPFP